MSSVQLAGVTLESRPNGSAVRGYMEWRKDGGYAAYIADITPDGMASARDVVTTHDVGSALRALADLVEAYQDEQLASHASKAHTKR